jgi:serine/threonine-protein kinase
MALVAERVGQLLDRKYRIVRLLGEGGMGCVYEARHELIGRRIAIKFLHPDLALHSDILMRFRREAQAAGALESENIAAVTDFGESEDGAPYIVMEFLVGEDLAKLLQRTGPLPIERVIDVTLQACRGLAAAHDQGIVHRDLKPENLFVLRHGDGTDLIKVLDFGIAKLQRPDAASSTRTGAAMGTPYYMPREQARGQKDLDARADVYALGVIMYELLSGQKPYVGDGYNEILFRILTTTPPSLARLRPELPAALVSLVERAMAPEPAERIASVRELSTALTELLPRVGTLPAAPAPAGTSAVAPAASTPSLTAPGAATTLPVPTKRSSWGAFTLAGAVVLAGLGSVAWRARRAEPVPAPRDAAARVSLAAPAQPQTSAVVEPPAVAPAAAATTAAATPSATASIAKASAFPRPVRSSAAVRHHRVDPYAP